MGSFPGQPVHIRWHHRPRGPDPSAEPLLLRNKFGGPQAEGGGMASSGAAVPLGVLHPPPPTELCLVPPPPPG